MPYAGAYMNKRFALRFLADRSIQITRRIRAIINIRTMGTEVIRSSDPGGLFPRKSGEIMACPLVGNKILGRLFRAALGRGQ